MVVTLDQQYDAGEKPTVILYAYINRHAGTHKKNLNTQNHGSTCCLVGPDHRVQSVHSQDTVLRVPSLQEVPIIRNI